MDTLKAEETLANWAKRDGIELKYVEFTERIDENFDDGEPWYDYVWRCILGKDGKTYESEYIIGTSELFEVDDPAIQQATPSIGKVLCGPAYWSKNPAGSDHHLQVAQKFREFLGASLFEQWMSALPPYMN